MVGGIDLGSGFEEQFHDVEVLGEGGVGERRPEFGFRGVHWSAGTEKDLDDFLIPGANGGDERFGFAAVLAVDSVGGQEFADFVGAASLGGTSEGVGIGAEFGAVRLLITSRSPSNRTGSRRTDFNFGRPSESSTSTSCVAPM